MKNKFLKKMLNWSMILVAATMILGSCNKDDDETPPVIIEDGIYVKGAGTALTDYDAKGLMTATTNEADDNAARAGLYDLYVAVKAGADGFNIIIVTGGEPTIYGPGGDYDLVAAGDRDNDEPQDVDFWRGSYADVQASVNPFTVNTDGLYHVVLDTELGVVAVVKAEWGIIGGATPDGWGGSTALDAGTFDLNKISYEKTEVIMTVSEYKFRYSDGWKIILDGENVRANTNFGGSIDALVAGAANIANTVVGVYTINMTWESGVGHKATLTKTGDYTPPAFPDSMFIVGSGVTYGWPSVGPGEDPLSAMHKIAGGAPNEGIFWKICHITANEGFKLSAAGWGDPNLGFADVDEYDANGVTVSDNGGNMSVAVSGMYMVVLDLQNDMKKVSIIAPSVYGIGDAFGANDWAEDDANSLFTVDDVAKTLTSPALTADGNIRMYVDHAWIPAWWNAEFNVYTDVIEYRNDGGGDQDAVAGTTGQIITLTFDDNTGVIN